MFCSRCGTKLDKKAEFCSECGHSLNEQTKQVATTNTNVQEGSSFGWGVLGFFIPLAGLILFIIWKTERPKDSKTAGIGALIRVILSTIVFILYFLFVFVVSFSEVTGGIYY